MPSSDEHLAKAEHNERFTRWGLRTRVKYYDWVLTGAFYAAVHYVEAVFAQRNHHSRKHADRDLGLGMYLPWCYVPYRKLKDLSTIARYQCAIAASPDFPRGPGAALTAVRRMSLAALGRSDHRS
jgi:hypothetical protein